MLPYPHIDPIAFSLGTFQFRWYGIMYLLSFILAWLLARWRICHATPYRNWKPEELDDLITWCMLGVVLGGRLGYVLFYDLAVYLKEPWEIFRLWNGGMSFHGGLLGVLAACWYFTRKTSHRFLEIVDFIAPFVPIGLFFGRIGNFINAELWGKVTNAPWGMVFPNGGPLPRHPSQLYEAFLEGIVLFILLWIFSRHRRPVGAVSGLFGLSYGIFRFLVEFIRLPDAQLGYLAFGWLTMGQILCLPLIFGGAWLLFRHGIAAFPDPDSATFTRTAKPHKKHL